MQSEGYRLHPLSLLFSVGALARNLLLPGIIVLAVASRGRYEAYFMILFLPAVARALFKYLTFRYRFDPDELVIREGLVFRNERHVPYARIQNIDLAQNPLHRLLSVAEVRLETAGGDTPEAVMRVLSLDAVETMRARVFERAGRIDPGTAPAPEALHTMDGREVFLLGLISNRGMVVVAALAGIAWQLDLYERFEDSISRETLQQAAGLLPDGWLQTTAMAVAGLILFVVLMRIFSVTMAILSFHGFRLTRSGEDLVAQHGLFTRLSKTIPRHRIQVVTAREGFLHRCAGRLAVQVETAGGGGDEEQGSRADRLWIAPLIARERTDGLLREVLPEVDVDGLRWQPISSRARFRRLRVAAFITAVATTAVALAAGWWALVVPLLLGVPAWLDFRLYTRHTAYALVPGAVFFKTGWWNRRMSVARFSKIQSVLRSESPFDRRNQMASVRVDTAGSNPVAHSIDIPYLDTEVAGALAARLYDEAGRTDFRW
jgi:putative membrane protein